MPTYDFECESCGHEGEVYMSIPGYKDTLSCPECQRPYVRAWKTAPNIKTGKRMEDLWKQMGWMDPEDPDYHKVNQQRVRAMREEAIKKRDKKLNEADMKKGRTRDFTPTDKPADHVSKAELDKLPDVAKDRVNMDRIANSDD